MNLLEELASDVEAMMDYPAGNDEPEPHDNVEAFAAFQGRVTPARCAAERPPGRGPGGAAREAAGAVRRGEPREDREQQLRVGVSKKCATSGQRCSRPGAHAWEPRIFRLRLLVAKGEVPSCEEARCMS